MYVLQTVIWSRGGVSKILFKSPEKSQMLFYYTGPHFSYCSIIKSISCRGYTHLALCISVWRRWMSLWRNPLACPRTGGRATGCVQFCAFWWIAALRPLALHTDPKSIGSWWATSYGLATRERDPTSPWLCL